LRSIPVKRKRFDDFLTGFSKLNLPRFGGHGATYRFGLTVTADNAKRQKLEIDVTYEDKKWQSVTIGRVEAVR
jgi:hypothetical protein